MGGRKIMSEIDAPILLDTHVILWSLLCPDELDKSSMRIIEKAQEKDQLFLSSITLWEIAMLKSKKRINIYEPIKEFLDSITNIDGLSIKEISASVAAESVLLNEFHGDPADRIIAATAISSGLVLLTRDKKILSWAEQGSIRAVAV